MGFRCEYKTFSDLQLSYSSRFGRCTKRFQKFYQYPCPNCNVPTDHGTESNLVYDEDHREIASIIQLIHELTH